MDGNSLAIRDAAEQIKSRLTMRDVLENYGFQTGYGNRIPCPIHNGHDKNFMFKPRYYRCFVCGAKGTVIDFVSTLYELDFPGAVRKINEDFRLSIPIDRYQTRKERQQAQVHEAARMRARAYEEMRNKLLMDLNRAMCVANVALKRDQPFSTNEITAIREYAYLEYIEAEIANNDREWTCLISGDAGIRAQRICREILDS